ncbi:MAG TPA: hypothetical protein VIN11_06705 [Roseivirga sp.]
MKKSFLVIVLFSLYSFSCGEGANPNLDDCPAELLCTEELRSYTYTPTENGEPLILDNFYVRNMENGNIYPNANLNTVTAPGTYLVITDMAFNEIKKSGSLIRFFGIKNNQIVIQTDFMVGHDCCHVIPLEGPFDTE